MTPSSHGQDPIGYRVPYRVLPPDYRLGLSTVSVGIPGDWTYHMDTDHNNTHPLIQPPPTSTYPLPHTHPPRLPTHTRAQDQHERREEEGKLASAHSHLSVRDAGSRSLALTQPSSDIRDGLSAHPLRMGSAPQVQALPIRPFLCLLRTFTSTQDHAVEGVEGVARVMPVTRVIPGSTAGRGTVSRN